MKVLLINPMIPTMPKGTRCLSTGLLWIGSYLKQKGHEVKMINIRNEPNYIDLIKREIKNSSCVGVTAMTAQIPNALEVCQIIKEKDSSIPIVWGGVHPTLYPKGTVEDELIDVSCEGEGEYPILELVKHFEKGGDLKNIDGISYKKNGEIIQNKPGKNFDLDELNHVYWELLDKKIMRKPETFEFPIHTSRGCPHRCTFCVNVVTQNFWRSRNPEKVVQDLEGIRDLGVSEIRFRDENFFVNKDLVKKITGEMIKREMKFKWYGSIRVDYLKPNHINMNIIKQVKQSGCQWLAFGAESGSQRILDILKKDITPEETLKSARICREVGIKPVYSFIIGIPGETKKDVFMSLNLIDKLKKICPKARINGPQILRVYPGGELYNQCLKLGWKEPGTLRAWKKEVMKDMAYVSAKDLPWVKNPDFLDAVYNTSFSTKVLGESLKNKTPLLKLFSLAVYADAKIRWKTRFFALPLDIKLIMLLRRYEYKL